MGGEGRVLGRERGAWGQKGKQDGGEKEQREAERAAAMNLFADK